MNLDTLFASFRRDVHFGSYQTLLLDAFKCQSRMCITRRGLRHTLTGTNGGQHPVRAVHRALGLALDADSFFPHMTFSGKGQGYWTRFHVRWQTKEDESEPGLLIELGEWEQRPEGDFYFASFDSVKMVPGKNNWEYHPHKPTALRHLNADVAEVLMVRGLLLLGGDDVLAERYAKGETGHERIEALLRCIDTLGIDREELRVEKEKIWRNAFI